MHVTNRGAQTLAGTGREGKLAGSRGAALDR